MEKRSRRFMQKGSPDQADTLTYRRGGWVRLQEWTLLWGGSIAVVNASCYQLIVWAI
jgi:hypothetical protein